MTDILEKSVTRADQQDYRAGGYPFVFNLHSGEYPGLVPLPPHLDVRWSYEIDRILRSTFYHESMWGSVIAKAISMQASLGFRCEDSEKSQRRINFGQQIFLNANGGQGWVHFLSQHLSDYLLTDNGAFVEVIRATSAAGSRILGVMHLSSARCRRTGDPDYPVIYVDILGREHVLRDYQVLVFSDMPRSDDNYFGVGRCAARRAYKTVYKLAALENYVAEKISGTRALALHFVNGISPKTLESILTTARTSMEAKNFMQYMGVIVAALQSEQQASGYEIPLAEVPDGFDSKQERDNAYVIYANAIGIAVQDIQPLSGQGLGTGTQSMILDQAAEGQGLAAWRKQWQHVANEKVLPEATTFHFDTNDTRDKKAKAELANIQAQTIVALLTPVAEGMPGVITPEQALQLAADQDIVPEEFLPQDQTPESGLNDTEKPAEMLNSPAPSSPGGRPAAALGAAPAPPSRLRQAINRAIQEQGLRRKEQPLALDSLIARASDQIAEATARLQARALTLDQWEMQMLLAIEMAYTAAYGAGSGSELTDADRALVNGMVGEQREFLRGFKQAISDGSISPAQAQARAQMYAESVKSSYWRGATRGYVIPAVPGDGSTQCLTNCKCSLRIDELEGDGDADIYWLLSDAEHCQGCIQRAADWSPLQVRDGEVVS